MRVYAPMGQELPTSKFDDAARLRISGPGATQWNFIRRTVDSARWILVQVWHFRRSFRNRIAGQ
jgi:hypothetical protein